MHNNDPFSMEELSSKEIDEARLWLDNSTDGREEALVAIRAIKAEASRLDNNEQSKNLWNLSKVTEWLRSHWWAAVTPAAIGALAVVLIMSGQPYETSALLNGPVQLARLPTMEASGIRSMGIGDPVEIWLGETPSIEFRNDHSSSLVVLTETVVGRWRRIDGALAADFGTVSILGKTYTFSVNASDRLVRFTFRSADGEAREILRSIGTTLP